MEIHFGEAGQHAAADGQACMPAACVVSPQEGLAYTSASASVTSIHYVWCNSAKLSVTSKLVSAGHGLLIRSDMPFPLKSPPSTFSAASSGPLPAAKLLKGPS